MIANNATSENWKFYITDFGNVFVKKRPEFIRFQLFWIARFLQQVQASNKNIKRFLSSQMWSIAKFGYIFLWMMMASQFGYQCNKIIK